MYKSFSIGFRLIVAGILTGGFLFYYPGIVLFSGVSVYKIVASDKQWQQFKPMLKFTKNETVQKNRKEEIVTTKDVIENRVPIVYVCRNYDGDWLFTGGEGALNEEDYRTVTLGQLVDLDKSVLNIFDLLPPGKMAYRQTPSTGWIICSHNYDQAVLINNTIEEWDEECVCF